MRHAWRAVGLLAAAFLCAAVPVCKIPVFRYALERWPSSPYVALVFHRGPLDEASAKVLDGLRNSPANITFEKVDVDGSMDPTVRKVWETQKSNPLPWVTVLLPSADETPVWAGKLEAEPLGVLVDSPARREIVKRIMSAESAVWLLIESGEKERDEAAAAMLSAELSRLEKTIELPVLGEDDPPLRSSLPLKLAFSVLRISRTDPAERAFADLLLRGYKGPPSAIVVPVVGRARAVWALAGEALKPESVADLAEFVTGSCSCEVKELNPGFDLLVSADWDALLELGAAPEEPPPLAIPAPVLPPPRPAPAAEPPPPARREAPPAEPSRTWMWIGLFGAAGFVLIAGLNLRSAFRRSP